MNQLIPLIEWVFETWQNFLKFSMFIFIIWTCFAALITLWKQKD